MHVVVSVGVVEQANRLPATLDTHLLPQLGTAPVSEVEIEEVEAVLAGMAEAGKSPKTRANAFRLAHQIFRFAQRRGWCGSNPCELLESPRVEPSADIRFLDRAELEALLDAVDTKTEPLGAIDRAIFLTAARTGLRQGELLALRWGDVDWTARKIRVRRSYVRGSWSTPKTRRGSRAVPLATRVKEELEQLRERGYRTGEDDLVFGHPSTGQVLDHSKLVARFKRALRKAGVREIRFHDLRHTFGTRMAASGVPPRRLQEWTGHRDGRTTEICADYEPGDDESGTVDDAFG